ncbi:MAG: hypothetical protein HY880_07790, partial [Deltaproteobacteria bacterium]|nr:hypothetical protein [Deltaproteobacteria bacterium]
MRLELLKTTIENTDTIKVRGRVTRVVGMVVEGAGVGFTVGEMCRVHAVDRKPVICEVVGFSDERVFMMPLGDTSGLGPGSSIERIGHRARVRLSNSLLGRVIDGTGNPMDGLGPIMREVEYPLHRSAPNPLSRARI